MDSATVQANSDMIIQQITTVYSNAQAYLRRKLSEGASGEQDTLEPIKIMNNLNWFAGMNVIQFLGGLGRHARSPEGISFTEFSYQLLQAYDFYHLWKSEGCHVQLGGSDQWGNITAGIDLIRRKGVDSGAGKESGHPVRAFGLTIHLMTTSTGEKFGKSAGNAVWLDSSKVSVQGSNAVKAETMAKVLFDSELNDLSAKDIIEAFSDDDRFIELSYSHSYRRNSI
ncbi:tyrosyl-tRNA synthetase [Phlyctochytrium planicorne]|nr:tyrosyl-tRNA synthetase [Phlyctochytrium planicorne]